MAREGKIWAVDPDNTTAQTEINIKGVTWSGMEKINMIPDGLYGSTTKNSYGTQGTKVVSYDVPALVYTGAITDLKGCDRKRCCRS